MVKFPEVSISPLDRKLLANISPELESEPENLLTVLEVKNIAPVT
jgi:hypothetical protein